MHPILASRQRLLLYLLAWTPILALQVYVTNAAGARLLDAAAVFTPAILVFAFVCLSPWPMCRTRPFRTADAVNLAFTFTVAGGVASLVLVGLAWAMAAAISRTAVMTPGLTGLLFALGVLLYLLSTGLHYAAIAGEASREAERRTAEA